MTINMYHNKSAYNVVNKQIELTGSMEGDLREPCSILDPVITIIKARFDESPGFNYVYIPDFERYYFVKGFSAEVYNLAAMSLHVDVLMTYKDGIKDWEAIIKRQENQFNLYLDDGIFKAYQNTLHKVIQFPYGFTDYSYILALAGNGDS